jgi:hypothetical protein
MKENVSQTHRPLRGGMLTLLVTVILICLSVLAVLALCTARVDRNLAQRQQDQLQKDAAAETAGQQWLAEVDAALKTDGMLPDSAQKQVDGTIRAQLALDSERTLEITIRPLQGQTERYRVLQWQISRDWDAAQKWNLWNGN